MTVSAVRPWRTALRRDACLPASVFGPVLLRALRRLAPIWRYEVMARRLPNWVRFEVLIPSYHFCLAMGGSSAIAREPRRQIDTGLVPPRGFVTAAMHLAMMTTAE